MKLLSHLNYIDIVARTGSIRRAADKLNITSTALNRRILALEDELGTAIFERLPQGVRLNVAGELLIQHIRTSMADLAKLQSQIADLSGVRAGHITIAAGSEFAGAFLPRRIAQYRSQYNAVSFEILRRGPEAALKSLSEYEADLSLILGAIPPQEYQILATVELELYVAIAPNHPLAAQTEITFMDCQDYPAILPAEGSGLYDILQNAQVKKGLQLQQIISSESFEFMTHYSGFEDALTFFMPFVMDKEPINKQGFVLRPLRQADKMHGRFHLVQAKGRVLSVAAAKFAEEVVQHLNKTYPDTTT